MATPHFSLCPCNLQLNEVMESETFNVARELLQKFDPHNPLLREMRERGGTPQRRQQSMCVFTNC